MFASNKQFVSPLVLIVSWCIFTIALVIWWISFASHLIANLIENNLALTTNTVAANAMSSELMSKQTMLFLEGVTLVFLLLLGGAALLYYVWREKKRNRTLKDFFTAFTHELKTPIASLRLQAESLEEDLTGTPNETLIKRLLDDTERLELRLENSLYLANLEDLAQLHIQSVKLSEIIPEVLDSYKDIQISIDADCEFLADVRGIESVLKNIASNAIIHGKADKLSIATENRNGKVTLHISDNGAGFSGDREQLGALFARHSRNSGSGLGLFLIKSLCKKMGGKADFDIDPKNQFHSHIELRAAQ